MVRAYAAGPWGDRVERLKSRIWELLEVTYDEGRRPMLDWYDIALMALILMNVVAVILQSVESIGTAFVSGFYTFEAFSVAVFTIEYVLRLWVCTSDPRYAHPVQGRLRYAFTPMVLIDLLSFAPFYMWFLPLDLRFLRILRLFRLLRVLKLGRYSQSLTLITRALKRKASDLIASRVVLSVMLVLASSVMYYVERGAQPAVFSSISAAMWWGSRRLPQSGMGMCIR